MLDNLKYDPHTPKCVDDMIGNSEIWNTLAANILDDKSSNLILVGPHGCGKSLFLRFALSGRQCLHIECTANPGLRDVRDSIHIYACGVRSPGANLRWVIFEHADNLTADTQAFLRRMLETTAGTTRFIFECRDVGAISEPILSRASIVNVTAPDDTEILYEIKRRAGFDIDDKTAHDIAALSFGNVRAAILNTLAFKHTGALFCKSMIDKLLNERPKSRTVNEWVNWAIKCENTCRINGIDLRDVLRLGWPSNPIVNNSVSMWPRLGGTSPRTLFYDCIYNCAVLC